MIWSIRSGHLADLREVEFPCSYDLKLDHDDPDLRRMIRGGIDYFSVDTPILGIHLREGKGERKVRSEALKIEEVRVRGCVVGKKEKGLKRKVKG